MKRTIIAAITLFMSITLQAQERVNNRMYNPDPAPVVSGDRLYVFTGYYRHEALDGSRCCINHGQL